MTLIDDRLLRVLFDVATGSMDFGSGFLDDEEVAALREVAVLIGADPDDATPEKFRCKYRGHHNAHVMLNIPYLMHPVDGAPCNGYRRPEDFPPETRPYLQDLRGNLGVLRLKQLTMLCYDCGRQWGALDRIPDIQPTGGRLGA